MKKAIVLIPVFLVIGRFLYHIIQIHRVTTELAGRYPGLSIYRQIKKGRT